MSRRNDIVGFGGMNEMLFSSFGKVRIGSATELFDSRFPFDLEPDNWHSEVTGSGTATHNATEAVCDMDVTTAPNDKVIRQSKRYFHYHSGSTQTVLMTGSLGDKKAGLRTRVGIFDDNDGVFFEQNENGLYIVQRTNVTGSPVDTAIERGSWNTYGGFAIDPTKVNIFFWEYAWLGVGTVRVGVVVDGVFQVLHRFTNENNLDTNYSGIGSVPLRYEIENTGSPSSATTMKQIAASVHSDVDNADSDRRHFCASTGTTATTISSRVPLISVRPKTSYNSITNRGEIWLDGINLMTEDNQVFWEVVYGGTLTGASWANVDATASFSEYDVTANSISGGTVVACGYLSGGSAQQASQTQSAIRSNIPVVVNYDASDSTPVSLVVSEAGASAGDANVYASVLWLEIT